MQPIPRPAPFCSCTDSATTHRQRCPTGPIRGPESSPASTSPGTERQAFRVAADTPPNCCSATPTLHLLHSSSRAPTARFPCSDAVSAPISRCNWQAPAQHRSTAQSCSTGRASPADRPGRHRKAFSRCRRRHKPPIPTRWSNSDETCGHLTTCARSSSSRSPGRTSTSPLRCAACSAPSGLPRWQVNTV